MFLAKDNKSPFYQIVYFVEGKRTKKSTKKKTKAEALKVLKQFEKPVVRKTVNKIIHLSKFREEYLEYSSQSKTKSYLKSICLSFRQLTLFTGDVPLNHLSTRILDQFITSTYSRSKAVAGLYYRTLKAAFSKAVVWEYITDNPFKKIKAPKQVESFPIFITKVELRTIVDNTEHEFIKDIIITGFYTGMRLSELTNMNWSWVDFNQNLLTVKNSNNFTTKSRKERIIPIHQRVKDILVRRYSTNGKSTFTFYRNSGIKLNEDFVSKQFKKAVRSANLNDNIHFHSLRHSFASALVQRGVSLYAVKELLGHENIKTTQIYSHLQRENLSQAVNLL